MIKLIAQTVNIFPGDGKNPYARTGEISFHHLKGAGATGVILGHSEIGDGPETVNKKLTAAFNEGLKDNVMLLGESWEELGKSWDKCTNQNKEKVKKIVKERFLKILENINEDVAKFTVFGYEPGWGVRGSGKEDVSPPSTEQIAAMSNLLRETVSELYTEKIAQEIKIIYGGSSSPERTEEIMPIEDIDGLILGSAGTNTGWVKKIGDSITKITEVKRFKRKPILVLNWKAYALEEPYDDFLKVVLSFNDNLDVYLAPPSTDLRELKEKIG